MGGGAWNANTHSARSAAKAAKGIDQFDHDQTQRKLPVDQQKVHDRLDPKLKAGDASPHAGQIMREVMISDEHPDPTAIVVMFDETGSMGQIPRVLQQKLAALHGLLVRKSYCNDPQILFGAIGDANTGNGYERAPLQVGQFESDNRMDEDLAAIFLEGNGGGQGMETYDLGLYFLARHTYLEPFEKHDKKGYAFFIGDERYYAKVLRKNVERLIGDTIEADIPIADIVSEVQERYNLFFVFAAQGMYDAKTVLGDVDGTSRGTWRALLKERAIELEDADAVCELIGATIGLIEGGVTLDDALEDLKDVGADPAAIAATGKALAAVGGGGGAVATASGDLPGLD